MRCKMCTTSNLLILVVLAVEIGVFSWIEYGLSFKTFLITIVGTAVAYLSIKAVVDLISYSIKACYNFLLKGYKKMNVKNILLSTVIILLIAMMLFPPYIITNHNHIAIETGYHFLFTLSDVTKGRFAATVNIQLLLVQFFALLVPIGFLLLLILKDKNKKQEIRKVSDILRERPGVDEKIERSTDFPKEWDLDALKKELEKKPPEKFNKKNYIPGAI